MALSVGTKVGWVLFRKISVLPVGTGLPSGAVWLIFAGVATWPASAAVAAATPAASALALDPPDPLDAVDPLAPPVLVDELHATTDTKVAIRTRPTVACLFR
jgi:hypothetical protein